MKLALKRLAKEYRELTQHTPEGVASGPISEDNLLEWEALITGPEDISTFDIIVTGMIVIVTVVTLLNIFIFNYDGGCFHSKLTFPRDYPLNPPTMQFTSPLWHPNIYPDGSVCISILHPPGEDKYGYEKTCERWSPVQSVEKILLSVISMLAEPNDESPANIDAAKMWRTDKEAFAKKADECVRKSIGI